ncbi:hypothetical protein BSLA_01r4098 [Burkholderia stabilis]|nr:hypothetical protein BSLA_01r4098 [Burkholderia stabilis]
MPHLRVSFAQRAAVMREPFASPKFSRPRTSPAVHFDADDMQST